MRVCEVGLGRLVTITIRGEEGIAFKDWDNEAYRHIPGLYLTSEGALQHMYFEPCYAVDLVESLKDAAMFQEEVKMEVWEMVGNAFVTKLHDFKGMIYDALLIAANEGKKYDV